MKKRAKKKQAPETTPNGGVITPTKDDLRAAAWDKARQNQKDVKSGKINRPEATDYYCPNGSKYVTLYEKRLVEVKGVTEYQRRLNSRGYCAEKVRGSASEIDRIIDYVNMKRRVGYVGPMAGHPAGVHEVGGNTVLIPHEYAERLPEATEGDWSELRAFQDGLLGEFQARIWRYWFTRYHNSVKNGNRIQSQAMVLVGPPGGGKSVKLKVTTGGVGERYADGYSFLNSTTQFNADVIRAEHVVIDDPSRGQNPKAREAFGKMIKQFTVTGSMRVESKGVDALNLAPKQIITIALNSDTGGIQVLPEMDGGETSGKFIIFDTRMYEFPVRMDQPEGDRYLERLKGQVAHMVYDLKDKPIPDEIADPNNRFGVMSYHSPEIVGKLTAVSAHAAFLDTIDIVEPWNAFDVSDTDYGKAWTGTTSELLVAMNKDDSVRSTMMRNYSSGPRYIGKLMSKLVDDFPDRVKPAGTAHKTQVWRINRPTDGEGQGEQGN